MAKHQSATRVCAYANRDPQALRCVCGKRPDHAQPEAYWQPPSPGPHATAPLAAPPPQPRSQVTPLVRGQRVDCQRGQPRCRPLLLVADALPLGGGLAQGHGVGLLAFGGAYWPGIVYKSYFARGGAGFWTPTPLIIPRVSWVGLLPHLLSLITGALSGCLLVPFSALSFCRWRFFRWRTFFLIAS